MAKGNLFLGTAARSVGDVVMYRREGSQVSRVRVRKIANPKTEAQCRQRAYMAPIPKFFSPLAVVLERSFEGLSKAKSYAKFIKVNADKARANDWLLPKGIGFFPLPYQLSKGSIEAVPYTFNALEERLEIVTQLKDTDFTTIGDISNAFVSLGYKNGDVVTLIGAKGQQSQLNAGFTPLTSQFIIDTKSTATIVSANIEFDFGMEGTILTIVPRVGSIVAGAIIIARFENDKWRRSTQSLAVSATVLTAIGADAYKAAAIESYSASAAGANPMVYLDGDELDNA